jgi:hypothetical protein
MNVNCLGPTNRAFCECDRILINKLADAPPLSAPIPPSACNRPSSTHHHGELLCCKWNTHYWAAYDANNKCCDALDGIKEIGLCAASAQ